MIQKKCPKCRAIITVDSAECSSCGIIFERYLKLRKKAFASALEKIGKGSLRNASACFDSVIQTFPESRKTIDNILVDIASAYEAKDSGKSDKAEILFNKISEKYIPLRQAVAKENRIISTSKKPLENDDLEFEKRTIKYGPKVDFTSVKPVITKNEKTKERPLFSSSPSNEKNLLTNCPACNKAISIAAESCPQCGQPLKNRSNQHINGLKTSLLTGIAGSILTGVGVFCPIMSAPIIGNINYLQNGEGHGTFILILAAISIILIFIDYIKMLTYTGIGCLLVMAYSFFDYHKQMNEMAKDLVDNPFRELADIAMQSIQFQWGWAILIIGSGLLITAGILETKGHK